MRCCLPQTNESVTVLLTFEERTPPRDGHCPCTMAAGSRSAYQAGMCGHLGHPTVDSGRGEPYWYFIALPIRRVRGSTRAAGRRARRRRAPRHSRRYGGPAACRRGRHRTYRRNKETSKTNKNEKKKKKKQQKKKKKSKKNKKKQKKNIKQKNKKKHI